MAIAFDAISSKNADGSIASGTTTWSHTTSGTDRLLFLCVATYSNVTISSVTYGGVALTLVKQLTPWWGAGTDQIAIYALSAPASGANTVSITTSGSARCHVISYNGAQQSTTMVATASATNYITTTFTATLDTTGTDGCWGLMYGVGGSGKVISASTNCTPRSTDATYQQLVGDYGPKTTGGSFGISMTISGTSNRWGYAAVAFAPASASQVPPISRGCIF